MARTTTVWCLTVLFVNFILFGCSIIYIHFSQKVDINRSSETKSYFQWNKQKSPTLVGSHSKTRNAVDTIREVLDAEYDQQDLLNFYSLVEKQLTLGVQCVKATSDIKVNFTNVPSNNTMIAVSTKNK